LRTLFSTIHADGNPAPPLGAKSPWLENALC
jgi:hypothetical protein